MLYCYTIRKKAAIGKTALRKLLRTPPVAISDGMYRSDKLFEAISKSYGWKEAGGQEGLALDWFEKQRLSEVTLPDGSTAWMHIHYDDTGKAESVFLI